LDDFEAGAGEENGSVCEKGGHTLALPSCVMLRERRSREAKLPVAGNEYTKLSFRARMAKPSSLRSASLGMTLLVDLKKKRPVRGAS
jgi:hypothetical protein